MTDSQTQDPQVGEGHDRRKYPDHDAYFNGQFDAAPLYVEPGQTAWSDQEKEMIVATLGTGVLVCVHDSDLRMGAAGYVLIPDEVLKHFPHFDQADPKLLDKAFQPIIDCIGHMKRNGAGKKRIRVRLLGGSIVEEDTEDKGTKNYVFAREYMSRQGLAVFNEDMGGSYIRRVHFFPTSGRAVRMLLRRKDDFRNLSDVEAGYQRKFIA